MRGAKGVIISIIGGDDLKLMEVDEAANHIRELVDPNANIIWGSAFNPDLGGKIRVSVVATGIEQSAEQPGITESPLRLNSIRTPARPSVISPATTQLVRQARPAAYQSKPVAVASQGKGDVGTEALILSEAQVLQTKMAKGVASVDPAKS
jgi:cell division protein FtsZ